MTRPVLARFLAPVVMRLLRAATPGMTALAVAAGVAQAQQAVHSPHGTLPDSLECSACHTAEGWSSLRRDPGFVHGARTGFVLTGAHESAACASCHTNLRFDGPKVRPDDCASCHADIHEGRMLPECSACHTTGSFSDVDGERIHARTSFPLTGAHLQITCESCHVTARGGTFTRLDPDCVSCHAKDYSGARAVDHVAAGYPTNCTVCHGTLSWRDTQTFDHAMISNGFVLRGAHTRLECASCHRTSDMAPLFHAASQDDCVACHQADYDREHSGTSFPTTCLSCHNMETWGDVGDFDHALTGFQLQGSHATLGCASCHTPDGRKLLFPQPTSQTDCVACHQSDYDHQHAGSGFPTTCLSCHDQSSWDAAGVDHAAVSGGFALAGPHATAACTTCHQIPGYQLLFPNPTDQTDCVACHQADYDAQHAGSGFPTTCLSCHQANTWTGATVDHPSLSGGFALQGVHGTLSCTACHAVPGYALLFPKPTGQNDCVTCHQSQFDAAHGGVGFPSTCLTCHTVNAWLPSTFDHDAQYFRIYSGTHQGRWDTCATCHTVPTDFAAFSCLVCHEHSKSNTDGHHQGVSGYVYDSNACYSCHRGGGGG